MLYCLGGGILLSWTGLGFIFSFLMLGITGMAALVRLHDSGTAALLGDFLTCLTEKVPVSMAIEVMPSRYVRHD